MAYDAAGARTEVRALLNEPVTSFFTDTEIDNWIDQGCLDISAKAMCVEAIASHTLHDATMEEDVPTLCIKVYGIYHDGSGLMKIHPRQIAHISTVASGTPLYWYEFGGKIGLYPVPDAGAAAKDTYVLYSKQTDAIADVPYHYQCLAILFAVHKAKIKEGKTAQAAQLYQQYLNSIMFHRQDLYDRGVDSRDMFRLPDRSVALQERG